MNILSLEFVVFVLATVIVYYIVPLKIRWCVLLAASGVFYGFAGWQGSLWLVLTAALSYGSSIWQHNLLLKERAAAAAEEAGAETASSAPAEADKKVCASRKIKIYRKLLLAASIILPLGAMAFSKYFDAIRALFTSSPGLAIIVPLGLSYFTFQCVGYMIDIYRGKAEPARNPLKFLLFASFFPQMTQGPIAQYTQLMPQLEEGHRFDPDNFTAGVQIALWGLFKKMIIADNLAAVNSAVSTNNRGWFILLSVIIYLIRLYCDFSGGMDVIRGAAKMLGIDMAENFRRPFFSFSVAEYWRRWHISLGNWFRNYVFYTITTSGFGIWLAKAGKKLFGKKAGRYFPATISTIVIFFLIGIWHVANLNAVLYGLYFGLTMGIELLLEPAFKKLKKKFRVNEKNVFWKAFTLVRTWILVLLAQYFAITATPKEAFGLLGATFRNWSFANGWAQFTDITYAIVWKVAGLAVVVLIIVDIICERKPDINMKLARAPFYVRWPVLIFLILAIVIFGCYGADYDATAFLYTHF
ncbi:MAG: MBOAT family protein [Parasporobacterium sp.]|nr:MBOAT family protein [Parasporobacterium sp.]